jgi:hypothetical protein
LAYTDDINIVGENVNTIQKKNTEVVLYASKEVDLAMNLEKTKYMMMSCYQKAGQKYGIEIANRSY